MSKNDRSKAQILEEQLQAQADTSNSHVLEDRGISKHNDKDETGFYRDEEMMYSGVVRPIGTGKFHCFKSKVNTDGMKDM